MSQLKPEDTVISRLRHWSVTSPDTTAFIYTSGSDHREVYTRQGIYSVALRCASWLKARGIREGDVVAILLPAPSAEQLLVVMGLTLLGAVPLPLVYIMFSDGRDVTDTLEKADAAALIVDPGDEKCMSSLRDQFGIVEGTKVSCPAVPSFKVLVYCQTRYHGNQISFIRDLEKEGEDVEPAQCQSDDVAVILTTSGTTGRTKLVPRTHRHMLRIGEMICEAFDFRDGEVTLNSGTCAWITGYIADYLVTAPTRLAVYTPSDVADPTLHLWKILCREQPRVGFFHPQNSQPLVQRHQELQAHGQWRARLLTTGSYPVRANYLQAVGVITDELRNIYGSTEIGVGNLYKVYTGNIEAEDFNCGRPIQGQELKILDKNFQEVEMGMRGQLVIRNDVIFTGYLKQPVQSQEVMMEGGWYLTGDSAWQDAKGDYFVEGRVGDSFLVHGFLLYPELLESKLQGHPGVLEAAVVGIPDPQTINRACVCVRRNNNSSISSSSSNNTSSSSANAEGITEETILNMYEEIFHSGYKEHREVIRDIVPKWCLFFEQFPRSWTGKLSRKKLRIEAMKRLGISE